MKKMIVLIALLFTVVSFSSCKKEETKTNSEIAEYLGVWKGKGEDADFRLKLTEVADDCLEVEVKKDGVAESKYSSCTVENVSENDLYLSCEEFDLRLGLHMTADGMTFTSSVKNKNTEGTAKPIIFSK